MKKVVFELIAMIVIFFAMVMLFFAPSAIFLANALLFVDLVFVMRYLYHIIPVRNKFEQMTKHIDELELTNKAFGAENANLETTLDWYKDQVKDSFEKNKELVSRNYAIKYPDIQIVHELPSAGWPYFRLYQGRDTNWYYSWVGPKRKYLFLGKAWGSHKQAVDSFKELITNARTCVLFDEQNSFPITATHLKTDDHF